MASSYSYNHCVSRDAQYVHVMTLLTIYFKPLILNQCNVVYFNAFFKHTSSDLVTL